MTGDNFWKFVHTDTLFTTHLLVCEIEKTKTKARSRCLPIIRRSFGYNIVIT